MIIRLLPTQVPKLWEAIKQAATQADEIEKEDIQPYLNELLHSLLNDKSQCWVRLSDEKRLLGLAVTKIAIDKITGDKSLVIRVLYSWSNVDDKEWQNDIFFVREFAKHEECKRISFESRNERVWQIGEFLGFKESLRTFVFNMEN